MKRLIVFCGAILLVGCAPHPPPRENLPAYAWTDDQTALRELASRARSVKTVSAAALLTLTRRDGQSVRLDGAIAMSLPDKSVRLRAWKLGQAVFDLTLTPGGLWIEIPKDAARRQQIAPASLSASQFARAISIFGGEVFEGPGVQVIDHGGPRFEVRKPLDNGTFMTADVERSTLAVRQYRLTDSAGKVRLRLTLRDYGLFNGIAWPTRLIARSENGAIDAELRDVELNAELPPAAFIPPHGAEKAP
jgi:outer membrane lipoprotein-sorting protein